jgi:putative membrane protein
MKKRSIAFTLPFLLLACNNEGKDSVEKADSANEAKMDSNSTTSKTLQTDEASSSFLVKAADGGLTEVRLGELAQQKATSKMVKDYGAMLIHDHSAANDKVKALAAQRNVTLPDGPGNEHQEAIDKLSKRTGKDFDKTFMDAMQRDHEKDIDMFKDASNKVNDADVKSFVDNTLPTLQMHLDSAKAIRKMLK